MFSLIFWIVVAAVIILWVAWKRRSREADRAAGIIDKWNNLRLTKTELIDGAGKNAKRYPLTGLMARVENSGTVITTDVKYGGLGSYYAENNDTRQVHLIIEGPDTAIARSLSLGSNGRADMTARRFASNLNLASRRLGH